MSETPIPWHVLQARYAAQARRRRRERHNRCCRCGRFRPWDALVFTADTTLFRPWDPNTFTEVIEHECEGGCP